MGYICADGTQHNLGVNCASNCSRSRLEAAENSGASDITNTAAFEDSQLILFCRRGTDGEFKIGGWKQGAAGSRE